MSSEDKIPNELIKNGGIYTAVQYNRYYNLGKYLRNGKPQYQSSKKYDKNDPDNYRGITLLLKLLTSLLYDEISCQIPISAEQPNCRKNLSTVNPLFIISLIRDATRNSNTKTLQKNM